MGLVRTQKILHTFPCHSSFSCTLRRYCTERHH